MTAPNVIPGATQEAPGSTSDTPRVVFSYRSTTSSRHPGRVFEGHVAYAASRIVQCPDCGHMRSGGPGPHAPRFNAQKVLVDCAGRPVGESYYAKPESELSRVSERIGAAIVAFCRANLGHQFHADDLRRYVREQVGEVAPESASRILRDLRQQGTIGYELVDRAASLYRVTTVHTGSELPCLSEIS